MATVFTEYTFTTVLNTRANNYRLLSKKHCTILMKNIIVSKWFYAFTNRIKPTIYVLILLTTTSIMTTNAQISVNETETQNQQFNDYQSISNTLNSYLISPTTSNGFPLKTDWYPHLNVTGIINGNQITMTRDEFIDLINTSKPAPASKEKIVSIDLNKNAACAKLEFYTPNHVRFTDYILLYKENDIWKASEKVFDSNTHFTKLNQKNTYSEYDSIEHVLLNYIESAKTGTGNLIKKDWSDQATVIGEFKDDVIKLSSHDFANVINNMGPAKGIDAKIITIDYNGNAAYAKLIFNNWHGVNYVDYLVLHKTNGQWKIYGKAYDIVL